LHAVTAVDGEIEVPAGIMAAIEMGCAEAGIEVITLWARVPHYVASMPYPIASAALIDAVAAVSGLTVSSAELRAKAEETRHRVDELVENNPDHETMVHNLESQADEIEPPIADELPSADELAEELERFLRDQES
jgi:predicted ATP-grasp superfamily ATP-dependent carboligase